MRDLPQFTLSSTAATTAMLAVGIAGSRIDL
jgi:hypothetical protein